MNFFHKKKFKVRIVDLQTYPKNEYPKNVELILGDIRDKKVVKKAVDGVDFVIHAAAALPLWKAKDIYTTNIDGTKNILEASKRAKVRQVVYISSTAVTVFKASNPRRILCMELDHTESKIAEKLCESTEIKVSVTILRPKTLLTHRLGVFEILFDWIKMERKYCIRLG